ncbi:MAG: 3-methyl-2-oxobutanoate dehydrogenase subunit VorB [Firmicutes bacterium]|nr:3-methyl-2-oxobutanoate dehydrogenase subunit VorB [Bacillota bacterium]
MARRILLKGNEALGEAAILAGCRYFFGYPITPQNEVPGYMARRLPEVGGVFLQAESEVSAISMVYGAAGAGVRVMTSSSSPGISLKQEGLSYLAASELPCVVANVMRAGPGLGGILASQSDYFQATKGGGHGDYRLVVLAPYSVQEMMDLTVLAFELADEYRNPVMILADGVLGQMMEPVELKQYPRRELPEKSWATTGAVGRPPNIVNSLFIDPEVLEQRNLHLQKKYARLSELEVRWEQEDIQEGCEVAVVAYGTMARVARSAIRSARALGVNAGLFRPISLYPFPSSALREAAKYAGGFLAAEMSMGQMVEDVRLALEGRRPVGFYGRAGGIVPTPAEVTQAIVRMAAELRARGSANVRVSGSEGIRQASGAH